MPDGSGDPIGDVNPSGLFWLLAGRPTNQVGFGGASPGGTATIGSTANSTKGFVYLGDSNGVAFDETNTLLGVSEPSPAARLHLRHATGGGTQTLHPSGNYSGAWGVSGASVLTALATNDGDGSVIQSGDHTNPGLAIEFTMAQPLDPGLYTGWSVNFVVRKTGTVSPNAQLNLWINRTFGGTYSAGTQIVSTTDFFADSVLGTSYATVTYSLSSSEAALIAGSSNWTVNLVQGAGGDGSNVINVTEVFLTAPGVSNTTPLQRWEASPSSSINDLNFIADGGSAFDLVVSGTAPMRFLGGTGTSGIRLNNSGTSGRLEAGTAAQANMNLVLSGARASQGTLLTSDFVNTLLTGHLQMSGSTSGTLTHAVPATVTSHALTWPSAQGAASSYLKNDGSGGLSWFVLSASSLPHNLLDSTVHSDTVTQTVSRGSLIYGNSTPAWDELVIGAANAFLGSNGTDAAWTAAGALTKTDDTNVTLTLGGTPTTALLRAASLTLGWTGTLAATRGGTGTGAYTIGDLLYADTTSTLAKLNMVALTNVLISGGVGGTPTWGKVALASAVSGTLPIGNGGTGQTTAPAAFNALSPLTTRGDLLTRDASNNVRLAVGTAGKFLRTDGTDPGWSTTVWTNAATTGDLLYASATNTYANLADVAAGSYLRSGGVTTAPLWSTLTLPNTVARGDILRASAANTVTALTIGASGTILKSDGTDPSWSTVAAAIAHPLLDGSIHNDTVAQAVSRGSLIYGNATPKWDELVIGAASTLLKSDGTDASWGTVNLLSAFHADTLAGTVARGDLVVGNATPKWARLAIGSANRVLRSDGTDASWAQVALASDVSGDLPFANLAQGSARSVLGVAGNATADVASIQGTTARDLLMVNSGGTGIGFETFTAAMIPAHDHSGATQGGATLNVPDTSFNVTDIADATKKLQLNVNASQATGSTVILTAPTGNGSLACFDRALTINGAWTFDSHAGGYPRVSYDGTLGETGLALTDTSAGAVATLLGGDLSISGSINMTMDDGRVVTDANTLNVSGTKTFTGLSTSAYVSTATSGFSFRDNITSTKRLRVVVSGAVGANSFTIANTAARNYTFGDVPGLATIVGNGANPPATGAIGKVDLTAQAADIASTKLTDTTPAGFYEVCYVLEDTTSDVTAGAVTLTISWTDDVGATTATANQILTGTGRQAAAVCLYLASGNITYATTHTGIFGTAKYALRIRCRFLG